MTEQQIGRAFPTLAQPAPPKTAGLPLVGALPALIRRQLDFFIEARARYGDVYTLDLGLSKLMVEAMSGRLAVESEVGRGSTFAVVLPGADGGPATR